MLDQRPLARLRPARLVVAGFLALLVIPGLLLLAGMRPVDLEGRAPATIPPVTLERLGDPTFFATADRATADAMPLRATAIGLRAYLAYRILGESPNPDVVRGPDDWLFALGELLPDCDRTAQEVLATVDRLSIKTAARDARLLFVVPPDKHAMEAGHLPADLPIPPGCTDRRRADMRAGMATRPATTVDLWSAIAAERARYPDRPLYFAQDTHWTPLGALAATRAIVERLAPGVWDEAEVPLDGEAAYDTDLSRLIGLPTSERMARLHVRPDVAVTETAFDLGPDLAVDRGVVRYSVPAGTPAVEGTTVVVHDSFFATNRDRVAPWFADSIWVNEADLSSHPDLAARLPAFDTLVIARVERSAYATDFEALIGPLLED